MLALTTRQTTKTPTTWTIASVGGVAFVVAVAITLVWTSTPGVLVIAVAPAVVAAAVDARAGRIPDLLVVVSAVPSVLVLLHQIVGGHAAAATTSIVGGSLVYALPLFAVHLVAPDALGFGDVKLAGALGLALGLVDPRLGVVALLLASGLTACAGVITARKALPLGPGLVLGAVVALVLAGHTGGTPLPWR